MFRPRDRRIETLGLGCGQIMNLIFRPAATWSPGGVGESGSLQVDVALDGVQLQSSRGVAVDLWLPVNHLKDSLGLKICSIVFNQVGLFRETEMFGNCTKTEILTWTSITLMSIKAVTEIPIMAPPFKTRTATCVIMPAVKQYFLFQKAF